MSQGGENIVVFLTASNKISSHPSFEFKCECKIAMVYVVAVIVLAHTIFT